MGKVAHFQRSVLLVSSEQDQTFLPLLSEWTLVLSSVEALGITFNNRKYKDFWNLGSPRIQIHFHPFIDIQTHILP